MAILNFPANPTVGQEYEFPPYIYVWDGEKWNTTPGSGGSGGSGAPYDGIRDGVIETAPTENAVFDALAGKANVTHFHTAEEIGALPLSGGKLVGDLVVGEDHVDYPHSVVLGTNSGEAYMMFKTGVDYIYYNLYVNKDNKNMYLVKMTTALGLDEEPDPNASGESVFSYDNGSFKIRNPRAMLAQEYQPASLTRKDYVDAVMLGATNALEQFKAETAQHISELTARIASLEAQLAAKSDE